MAYLPRKVYQSKRPAPPDSINVFASIPVVTATQAWLGTPGSSGGLTVDNAVVNEITKVYTTVKVGSANGDGDWRSFTIVLTGHENIAKKPENKEEAH
ncbi:hypothetical protein K443DRAFT_9662 [Laccaria amethystina LaAM-08-1]|uniref:Uncharacterized protein n=1 Tax=Laccaria amethystina LaAM-08-1 TaxID=1095629 RepID=A0A0C9WY94_9AGAR|nr:hypothetical protein K443DRAFT_9662 [Laccaria amethystina LaAM-08-1]